MLYIARYFSCPEARGPPPTLTASSPPLLFTCSSLWGVRAIRLHVAQDDLLLHACATSTSTLLAFYASSLMVPDGAGACGACCSCTPSNVKPLTALCPAAESCVRCGDGRCHGRRTSAGTPTRPCFASRLSSSSKPASRHSRHRGPQAITLSDPTPLPTDLLLSVPSVLAALACCVCINKHQDEATAEPILFFSPTAISSHWLSA